MIFFKCIIHKFLIQQIFPALILFKCTVWTVCTLHIGKRHNQHIVVHCEGCSVWFSCCVFCATENSCKGRCGENFRRGRGRGCSCDSDCMKFKQCCSDYKTHCDAEGKMRLTKLTWLCVCVCVSEDSCSLLTYLMPILFYSIQSTLFTSN